MNPERVREMEELALRRTQAIGRPVVVAGFAEGDDFHIYDTQIRLVPAGRVPFEHAPDPETSE